MVAQEKLVQLEPPHWVLVSNDDWLNFEKRGRHTWSMGRKTVALPVHSSFTILGWRGWATDPFNWEGSVTTSLDSVRFANPTTENLPWFKPHLDQIQMVGPRL